jgi:hypothetical protein
VNNAGTQGLVHDGVRRVGAVVRLAVVLLEVRTRGQAMVAVAVAGISRRTVAPDDDGGLVVVVVVVAAAHQR